MDAKKVLVSSRCTMSVPVVEQLTVAAADVDVAAAARTIMNKYISQI